LFLFRLALALGRTVGELLDSISGPELLQWSEYYAVEPFGEMRDDFRSAQVCAILANSNRDRKARPEPFALTDFLLFRQADPEPETASDPDEGATVKPEFVAWLFVSALGAEKAAEAMNGR
jgi:Protein of unknown function (DUF4035)